MQYIPILLLLLAHYAAAQCPGVAPTYTGCTIKYQYDMGGNRKAIIRQCISAPPDPGNGGGTGRVASNPGVSVYPNPTTAQVDIVLDDATMQSIAADTPLILTVFDLTGKQIVEQQVAADTYNIALDLSSQASGMYIAMLRQAKQTVWQGKIIKTDR
jgi:Secretion system C-terminal sorting domain